jgi:hypothetical protein
MGLQSGALGNGQFRCGRGSGSPGIGHEICDGEVHLVAHRAHDRHRGAKNCPGHDLFVETPEIFQRSPSTTSQDQVHAIEGGGLLQGSGNLVLSPFPLHSSGDHDHVYPGKSPPQNPQHVMDRGPGGRGHQGNASRQKGEGALPGFGEEAFLLKPGPQLFELLLEFADPLGNKLGQLELHVSPSRVDGQSPEGKHFVSLSGTEGKPSRREAKHDCLEASTLILEGEVDMSRRGRAEITNLPGHPDGLKTVFQKILDLAGEFRNGPRLGRHEQEPNTGRRGGKCKSPLRLRWRLLQ